MQKFANLDLCNSVRDKWAVTQKKNVFAVSQEVRFKPACSATEPCKKIEISLVASLDIYDTFK